jgi:hypothetical protein
MIARVKATEDSAVILLFVELGGFSALSSVLKVWDNDYGMCRSVCAIAFLPTLTLNSNQVLDVLTQCPVNDWKKLHSSSLFKRVYSLANGAVALREAADAVRPWPSSPKTTAK